MTAPQAAGAPLRDAATVVVLRDGPEGGAPELLLLRRHGRSGFAARAWVFPGGTVDPADAELAPSAWSGVDPRALAPRFGRSAELALGLCVAAVRETFEEAGLLFARGELDIGDPEVVRHRRAGDFHRWLPAAGLVLDLGALTPFRRWLTPVPEPRRYDTIFFLARAPEGQIADHDRVEITESRWLTAADALAAHAAGELPLIFPTIVTLEELAALGSADAMLADVPPDTRLRPLLPHMEVGADGTAVSILHPDDPAYPRERYPEPAP
jgi:8-oxo-dGTP pyrophosphatase MutT (NUDIX family)